MREGTLENILPGVGEPRFPLAVTWNMAGTRRRKRKDEEEEEDKVYSVTFGSSWRRLAVCL